MFGWKLMVWERATLDQKKKKRATKSVSSGVVGMPRGPAFSEKGEPKYSHIDEVCSFVRSVTNF